MKKQALLVLNCGSTSIKFSLYEWSDILNSEPLARGSLDLSVSPPSLQLLVFKHDSIASFSNEMQLSCNDSTQFSVIGIKLLNALQLHYPHHVLQTVAHRVVHGGASRNACEIVTPALISELVCLTQFAPLHQPVNLAPISAIQTAYPAILQIACFDTAFHRDQPTVMQLTALPHRYFEHGIRRMGFHGLSYTFVVARITALLGYIPKRLVAAHLGGGASVCGMLDGVSVSCSMGTTALDGLPMATRSGSIDAGLMLHLMESGSMSIMEMRTMLYEQSGLLGISGISGDIRQLIDNQQARAQDAIEFFVQRTAREIAATATDIGGIDALVFTGGIGENQPLIRQKICEKLAWLGVRVTHGHSDKSLKVKERIDRQVHDETSNVRVWVVHTDEEFVICKAAISLIEVAGLSV